MKTLITNYTFAPSTRQITFTDFGSISLKQVQLITNTTSNTIIYNFAVSGMGGTVSGNVLTLAYNTTSMSSGDQLQIFYDVPSDMGTGNATTTGTQRVVLASNQPVLPVSDNSGSLTVDAPVATPVFVRLSSGSAAVDTIPSNVTQIAGTTVATGNGGVSTGVQRVAIASDNTAFPVNATLQAGSNAIGKLAANAGVDIGAVELVAGQTLGTVTNLSQIGGQAVAMGTGTRSAGAQRVTVATDDIIQTKSMPDATSAYAPSNATTTAYVSSLVVKASAGNLYMVTGYNSKNSNQFIQIHDSASLPADTAVPKIIFIVPSSSNFSFDLGVYGRYFSNGIVICNSTTGPTKTIGAADCWFDVQYK